MSILVTGAAGLIGSQIVRTLLDRGEIVSLSTASYLPAASTI
jgi:uncharacterized protein YbjT (DUF2867 family)